MLTFFTTAKPFEGHSGVIQRNALKSWKLLHPDIEVILFGDDAGSAEIANGLGLRHEPFVERNSFGTKRLSCKSLSAPRNTDRRSFYARCMATKPPNAAEVICRSWLPL